MYVLDWFCSRCRAIYKTKEGYQTCPNDGTNLELQFKTVKFYGPNR